MASSILCISINSRTRRLYHRLAETVDCECRTSSDIAEALTLMTIQRPSHLFLDSSIPVFEVSVLLDLLEKKPGWKEIQLAIVGFDSELHHIFPHRAWFLPDSEEDIKDTFGRIGQS